MWTFHRGCRDSIFFLEEPNIGINLSARQAGVVGTNSVLQVPKLFNATPAKKWHNDRYQYQRVVFEICEVPPAAVPLVPSPVFVILLKKLIPITLAYQELYPMLQDLFEFFELEEILQFETI